MKISNSVCQLSKVKEKGSLDGRSDGADSTQKNREKVDFFCFLLRSDQIWFMLSQKDKKKAMKKLDDEMIQ